MKEFRYTLLSDGPSDRALIPILTWLWRQHTVECAIQSEWADLGRLRNPPKPLSERIKWSFELYLCDVLFVHRDAETEPHQIRVREIRAALEELRRTVSWDRGITICVVPVRMTEAWLLLSEDALRHAAGNPSGRDLLELPSISELEGVSDPKNLLHNFLRQASGLSGRRLKRFRVSAAVQRIPDFIGDFSPLRTLPAFQALEEEVERVVQEQGWATRPVI